ncbi:hypothetical protein EVAR_83716_1 [Eumeta japonica]|uniref:Uncharacterized protein n=1 Tax=Eumeta variegata TaxID=151549 RepID=A0A4C1WD17_EUMVA|nr:hypothetical protein EVAR_83716_1 [Eumeta japonica]
MFGQAPRRLQRGRRAASDTSASGKRRGGRTSALCTSVVAAVLSRLHFNELKCGDISWCGGVYVQDLNKLRLVAEYVGQSGARRVAAHGARVRQQTRTQDGLRWSPWASGASSTAYAGGFCSDVRTRTRGRLDGPGELASDPAVPRRGVRRGPLPGVNCADFLRCVGKMNFLRSYRNDHRSSRPLIGPPAKAQFCMQIICTSQ